VGLGANLGDAASTLASAIEALAALPGTRLAGVSRLYATTPVGVTDQPEFRNAVVALDVPAGADPAAGALRLLTALKGIERSFGRRDRGRWAPRELDLDLLVFGRHQIGVARPPADSGSDPTRADAGWLTVPHPAARDRLFVLAPLADLVPGLRPPGWRESVAAARARAEEREGVQAARPIAAWGRSARSWTALPSRERPPGGVDRPRGKADWPPGGADPPPPSAATA
jgi:2-amino-4-hydroxy-6-hydroxymethyldihydropteridine diphosphokinase